MHSRNSTESVQDNPLKESEIADSLSPLERKVLPLLTKYTLLSELVQHSGLQQVEVMRALQWLSNKKLITLSTEEKEIVELAENGKAYLEKGLPEKRFLRALSEAEKGLPFKEIASKSGLEKQELNASLGLLKSRGAIEIDRGIVSITEQGKALLSKQTLEEKFLQAIASEPKETAALSDEEKYALDTLKKRQGIIRIVLRKEKIATLTETGRKISKMDLGANTIEKLTPEIIKKGLWKNKTFRRFDVQVNVPKINFGRRHFINEAVDYVRRIWIEMGFQEMTGSLVQTSFWNFDALFTAQDHPVREMQDTFFIENPDKGKLPDKKIVAAVKKAHEHGVSGSRGWKYKWSQEEAKRNVLRTHTTVLSARTLAALSKEKIPAKFFSVGKCFRNETLDYSHLFEFYQVEGIVVDPNANFRHLLGYLTEFFKKMGYEKIRIRPAYFPYTEPSAEVDVYDKKHGRWLELAGAGIFRPEVVAPLLGEDITVLAWGLGFPRIIKEYYNFDDIRELYRNDLKTLREVKLWTKQTE
ncbi:phenylalanine--tRNA ligase subunit alpha [Candidatus Woesearchaeota archaeon]|nr:MAG: phenylalanine--tRNA ligase subunit alpha [Candidatus Woesearchaeota archaeon]